MKQGQEPSRPIPPSMPTPIPRRIRGFRQDEAGDWIADLECGHSQHVRHNPPWENRPWVMSADTRDDRVGSFMQCLRCAQQ